VLGDATSDPDVSHRISIHHRGECWREDWCWLLTFQMDLVGLAYELANGSCNHPVVRYVSTRGAVARQLRNTITKSPPPPFVFFFLTGCSPLAFLVCQRCSVYGMPPRQQEHKVLNAAARLMRLHHTTILLLGEIEVMMMYSSTDLLFLNWPFPISVVTTLGFG
jgi:hypothetical protein